MRSAGNPDGDAVSYSIVSGNGEGAFSIDDSSGSIVVASPLDHESVSTYTLTVEARDGKGGVATATVVITITDVPD